MRAIRERLTYANVMATVAVFIAIGGVSYAAIKIPAHSVGTKQLKKHSVSEAKLKANSVGPKSLQGNAVGYDQLAPLSVDSQKVKDGSLGYSDLDSLSVSPRLFAHVASNGTLAEQSGVASVTRLSQGVYDVEFDRSLVGCVGVASVGYGIGGGMIGAGATAQVSMHENNDNSQVKVTIYRGFLFADVADSDFHLIIAC